MKNDGTHVCTLEGPNEVSWIDWHPKGHVLLAGGEDGTCWMFHIPSGQCMQVFSGHSESSTCGGFSPDGKLVATGSTDSSVIVWDPKTGSALQRWDPKRDGRFHQSGVSSLVFSADGSVIFSGGSDGTVNVLHTATGKFIQAIESHSDSVESMAVSKNMPWLATSSVDGTIHVWDISLMKIRFRVTHEVKPKLIDRMR